MYLFIAIIFIAELIIACTIINYIIKADKAVCRYNECIKVFNPLVQTCLQYARCLVTTFNSSFESFIDFVRKKQEQIHAMGHLGENRSGFRTQTWRRDLWTGDAEPDCRQKRIHHHQLHGWHGWTIHGNTLAGKTSRQLKWNIFYAFSIKQVSA